MSTVAISGIAMSTAVGPDVRTSAAAFRAGISRARALEHFTALDDEETDVGPISGHIAAPNAIHTEGLGKIVALGAGALRALVESTGPRTGLRTGFHVAVPNHSLREQAFLDVGALVASGSRPAAPSGGDDEAPWSIVFAEQSRDHLFDRLTRAANVRFAPTDRSITFGDNTAFLRALDAAYLALTSGAVERCIVGGIDSYVDAPSLEWGMATRRMKSDSNPTGFAPGEAAVFIELTINPSAEAPVHGHLSRPGFGDEPGQLGPAAEPPRGLGIAQALREAITNAQRPVGLVIADLNGDATRAMDWGWAVVRSAAEHPALRDAAVWTPAASFGETGCASAGLAIGVAVEAFGRRYARTDSVLIVSTSDTGDRGAVVVSASPG